MAQLSKSLVLTIGNRQGDCSITEQKTRIYRCDMERAMQRFQRMHGLQKFALVHSAVHNHFNQERQFYSRENYKLNRAEALAEWLVVGAP